MKSLLGKTRKSDVTFYRDGMITISMHVSQLLNLQPSDVIDVLTDNGEYYFYVSQRAPYNGQHKGMVRRVTPTSRAYRTNYRRLARAMLEVCGTTDVARLTVGDPIDIPPYGIALPIITKRLL